MSLNHKGNKQACRAVYRTGLGDTAPLFEASSPCLASQPQINQRRSWLLSNWSCFFTAGRYVWELNVFRILTPACCDNKVRAGATQFKVSRQVGIFGVQTLAYPQNTRGCWSQHVTLL